MTGATPPDDLTITAHAPGEIGGADLEAVVTLMRTIDVERDSTDPWQPDEAYRGRVNRSTIDRRRRIWLGRRSGEIVAMASLELGLLDNLHLVHAHAIVHAEGRRRGIGSALLEHMRAEARAAGRTRMISWIDGRIAAGAAFATAHGFALGMDLRISDLDLVTVDRARLAAIRREAEARSRGYMLQLVPLPTPDALLADIGNAINFMNDAPHDNTSYGTEVWTPERVRDHDRSMLEQGRRRWSILARDPAGAVAGITEISYARSAPELVQQHDTGVGAPHRGKRLGLRLKTAMLEYLLADVPRARRIRTGNAESNRWMVAINEELGFRRAFSQHAFEATV